MKYLQSIAFALIIGSIMVVSAYGQQEVSAIEEQSIIEKMIDVDRKLSELDEMDTELNELTMSKISFKIKQIKNTMLEINNANDGNYAQIDKIYEHLSNNYDDVFEEFQNDIKKYQKENGLTIQEKKIISEVFKNKSIFEIGELEQNSKKSQEELIKNTIKEVKAKKDYQKLVTEIGIKLVNEANGGKVEKIHHKLALKEIIDSKKWEMASPAIERVLVQTNDEQLKEELLIIKNNIKQILEKREKQGNQEQLLSLKSDGKINDNKLIQFNPNNVEFENIPVKIHEYVIDEVESKQRLDSAIKESDTINVIEPIFEAQLIGSIENVEEISDKDSNEVVEEREEQRKEAREKGDKKEEVQKEEVQKEEVQKEEVQKEEVQKEEPKKEKKEEPKKEKKEEPKKEKKEEPKKEKKD